ncbi:MAG: transglutaminase-like cysteine peptidase [Mesorhizobium sp.]|nr:transglutaminase-like cysteine peptidase [Mesorhizobium sp.]MBN9244060.1 transglutaminase-like cysteine peptidase [Mesorhizobium sp.]
MLTLIDQEAKDKPFLERVRIVNSMVNGLVRYRTDRAAYGVADHWATPTETLARGTGDCEDFAILKMTALMREGVPARSLSIVVLHDSRHMAFHAVLAVSTSEGRYILDNAIADVVRDRTLPNYQPLYSLSTDRAWVHGTRSPSSYATASAQSLVTVAPGDGVMEIE